MSFLSKFSKTDFLSWCTILRARSCKLFILLFGPLLWYIHTNGQWLNCEVINVLKSILFLSKLIQTATWIMHEVSDLSYGTDLWCDHQMKICFLLLELSMADYFIFIVTGLDGERKRWYVDAFALKLLHWSQLNSFSIMSSSLLITTS